AGGSRHALAKGGASRSRILVLFATAPRPCGGFPLVAMLESILQDVRFAFRTWRKNVVLTGVMIVTLAFGVGINSSIFTVVNAVLLRALPYKDSDRLVWVWSMNARGPLKQRVSYPDFLDWRGDTPKPRP